MGKEEKVYPCSYLRIMIQVYKCIFTMQILMSALLAQTTVTLMLYVPILLEASPVPVTKDTEEMESTAMV